MAIEDFYTDFCRFKDPELIQTLVNATNTRSIKKGEFLIRANESQTSICFLTKGLLRGFFLDINGKDVTDCLGYQYGLPAMASCQLEAEMISPMSIEMLEDSEFLCIPISLIVQLLDQYQEVIIFYNKILIKALNEHWRIKQILHQYTAVQRYQWFLETYPELVGRVSNKYIASFLRMTPVTLSRIRREIREGQNLC